MLLPNERTQAVEMHAHMLDFKKRGSFYRRQLLRFFGYPVPMVDTKISPKPSRWLIESIIVLIIISCRSKIGRWLLMRGNPDFLGILFDKTRSFWKMITKGIKRKGLYDEK